MGVGGRKPSMSKATVQSKAIVPTGEPGAVVPPEVLTSDAQLVWDKLLPDLISLGAFRESDVLLLTELCETLATAQSFRRQVNGLMARLEEAEQRAADLQSSADPDQIAVAESQAEVISGRVKRARAGYLQSMKLVMSIAGEFGISPVARLRLGLMRIQGGTLLGALGGDDD